VQVHIEQERVKELFRDTEGRKIAVIGDIMLDQYYWGSVSRISPEAPVPVVEVHSESIRLGGAANVANNITALGAQPYLIGVVGSDMNGEKLSSLVTESGLSPEGIIVDDKRATTIKSRVIAHGQHVVRFDRETTLEIDDSVGSLVLGKLRAAINDIDAIILQDYNKGIFSKSVIGTITRLAHEHSTLITVDPKFKHFFEYKNVAVFKPNRRELEQAFGIKLQTNEDFRRCGKQVLERINAQNVLITRGEQGMTLIEKTGAVHHVPTRTRSIADVSGAGDTVIATLTAMLAAGADIGEASSIANFAGGVVCEEIGIVPVNKDRLIDTIFYFDRENPGFLFKGDG
jgi:D-glycero-beta-D-manno-heptose-7-phosphate kinase